MKEVTLAFFIVALLNITEKRLDLIEALLSKEAVYEIG